MLREVITVSYEQHIGRREPGQSCEGDFPAAASRVLIGTLDEALERWLRRVEGVPTSAVSPFKLMSGKASEKPAWTAQDFAAMGQFMESFNKRLVDSGELVETRGLTAPVHARRIQLQNGVPVVTDGPYAETQEVLAGYWIIECDSFDRS